MSNKKREKTRKKSQLSTRKRISVSVQPELLFSMAAILMIALLAATASVVRFNRKSVNIVRSVTDQPLPTPTPLPVPQRKQIVSAPPYLSARSAVAVDVNNGYVLYAKEEALPLRPASTTKIMTALVALDEYGLNDIVTVSNPVQEGSIMGLISGERISVENLLYGILIQSANDAAFTLSDYHEGGRETFVRKMNKKAMNLGLDNTHFTDPAGFDNEKQYTTAEDLVTLTTAALKNSVIKRMVSTPSITVPDDDYVHFHKLTNVNRLLGTVPGVAGVKTGWTENAKENLINLTKRNGDQVLTVILGSDDRFLETQLLTNWVFENYTWATLIPTTDQ